MMPARYRIDFECQLFLKLNHTISAELPGGSKVFLHATENGTSKGEIEYELAAPNDKLASHEGRTQVRTFIKTLLVATDSIECRDLYINEPPTWLNPDDFASAQITRSVEYTVDTIFVKEFEQELLDRATGLLVKIMERPKTEQELLLRALSWYQRGCQSNAEDQFIFWWIAFDSLLGLLGKKQATPNLIPEFVETYLRPASQTILTKHHNILDELSNANLRNFRGTVDRSEQLKQELQRSSHTPKVVLRKALLCVYEFRNGLFHGGVSSDLIEECALFLATIIREAIRASTTSTP